MTTQEILIGDDGELLIPTTSKYNLHPVNSVLHQAFLINPDHLKWMERPHQTLKEVTRDQYQWKTGIVFALFICLALAILSIPYQELAILNGLREVGTTVKGKVIDRREEKRSKITDYYLVYQFETDYGWSYKGEQSTDHQTFLHIEIGTPLSITYLRTNPSISRPTETVPDSFDLLVGEQLERSFSFFVFSLVLFVVPFFGLIWLGASENRKLAKWIQNGARFVTGDVIACKRHRVSSKKEEYIDEIQYNFSTADGKILMDTIRQKHCFKLTHDIKNFPPKPVQVGTPVIVVYLNDTNYLLM